MWWEKCFNFPMWIEYLMGMEKKPIANDKIAGGYAPCMVLLCRYRDGRIRKS